jgi:hypothetical protein
MEKYFSESDLRNVQFTRNTLVPIIIDMRGRYILANFLSILFLHVADNLDEIKCKYFRYYDFPDREKWSTV